MSELATNLAKHAKKGELLLAPYPGLLTRDPSVIAGVLYRDFSWRRDDVTVIVAKSR